MKKLRETILGNGRQSPGVNMKESDCITKEMDEGLSENHWDPLIRFLIRIIRHAVRALAVLMVLVILWGIGDVVWILYNNLVAPPFLLLNINDLFATFGAFLAVLIAIEIFMNIILYLRDDIIHVRLVLATALMAIARKVIVLDFKVIRPEYVAAIAAVVIALGVTYYLVYRIHESQD